MMMTPRQVLGLAILAGTAFPQSVEAARGVPIAIIWGQSEEIAHVGDLPAGVRGEVSRELGSDVAIGFFYKRAHLFWLSVWTWDGQHVLYNGDAYWVPPPDAWKKLLGADGAANLPTPIYYRFPLGLDVAGVLLLLSLVLSRAFPSDEKRARRLIEEPRYREAVGDYLTAVSPPKEPPDGATREPLSPEVAFERSVRRLRNQGLSAEQAEADLRFLLHMLSR